MRMLSVVGDCVRHRARRPLGVAEPYVVEVEISGQEIVDLFGESASEVMNQGTEHMFVRYATGRMEVPKSTQETLQTGRCPLIAELPKSGVGARRASTRRPASFGCARRPPT